MCKIITPVWSWLCTTVYCKPYKIRKVLDKTEYDFFPMTFFQRTLIDSSNFLMCRLFLKFFYFYCFINKLFILEGVHMFPCVRNVPNNLLTLFKCTYVHNVHNNSCLEASDWWRSWISHVPGVPWHCRNWHSYSEDRYTRSWV